MVADLPDGDKEVDRTSLATTYGIQFGIYAALRSANQTPTSPFFDAQTGGRGGGVQVGGVEHDALYFAVIRIQPHRHLGKDAFIAPSPPKVIEDLVRAIFSGRISLLQAIAIDEDYAAQGVPSVRRLARKIVDITASFSNDEARRRPKIYRCGAWSVGCRGE